VSRQLERKTTFFIAGADLKHDFSGTRRHLKNHLATFGPVSRNNFVERIGWSEWNVVDADFVPTAEELLAGRGSSVRPPQ